MNELDKVEVELKLTVAHINTILSHLGRGAYMEVSDLIAHIRDQAMKKINASKGEAVDEEQNLEAARSPAPAVQ
jgi:hypothetical protein